LAKFGCERDVERTKAGICGAVRCQTDSITGSVHIREKATVPQQVKQEEDVYSEVEARAGAVTVCERRSGNSGRDSMMTVTSEVATSAERINAWWSCTRHCPSDACATPDRQVLEGGYLRRVTVWRARQARPASQFTAPQSCVVPAGSQRREPNTSGEPETAMRCALAQPVGPNFEHCP